MKRTCLTFKLIASFCLIILIISSCKKSSTTSSETYSISFSIQGTKVIYAYKTVALFATFKNSCGLTATSSDGSSGIAISVLSNSALSTGITYTDSSSINQAGFQINSPGKMLGVTLYANTPDVKLNFTDITSTYVKGTFSGNIAATAAGTSMSVSNGTFYLPITQ